MLRKYVESLLQPACLEDSIETSAFSAIAYCEKSHSAISPRELKAGIFSEVNTGRPRRVICWVAPTKKYGTAEPPTTSVPAVFFTFNVIAYNAGTTPGLQTQTAVL
jgi:hypothetical protein